MASIEQIDIDKILVGLKHAAATAANEEELRIRASGILESEVISKLGITPGKYEYTFVSGGRPDALYGHVIIEYKAPGKLLKEPDVAKAKEQLIGYIRKEGEVADRFKLFLGVILADRIAFVRYDEKTKNWLIRGPYDLNRETVLRLVEAIRGLRRKKLAVDELLKDFGPKSDSAVSMVNVFYGKVVSSKSPKVEALFNDWKRLFSQVCSYSPEKLKGLEAEYGLSGKVDYSALFFAVHTYYALVMKLLAAEVAYLFGASRWLKSYVTELEDANMKGLDVFKRALEDLESGGVFKKFLNITNFIEGDYFSWYLEELDQETVNKIAELAKRLADYEPATPILEPEYTRDLLKRLYQNLVPKKIRHDLGEYYTPDWLAEFLLNEVGLTVESFEKMAQESDSTKPLDLRILDPACGSGTFLVLTMKKFREYAEGHYLKDVLVNYLLRNVVGFDLNPLAVLAARTNYLLAIADLLAYAKGPIEIPIYLADSLLVETRATLTGISYVIRTYVGVFELPKSVVDKGLLGKLLEAVDRYVRLRYRCEEFKQVIKEELRLSEDELRLIADLYKSFLQLEENGKNHVWTSIIRNAFAPLTIVGSYGKFDYVVGNPPWILWDNLPSDYRDSTKSLWQGYGLFTLSGLAARHGGGKKDVSVLFTYTCLDKYLKDQGIFGFLITQAVFKTKGAGEGFRRFKVKSATLRVRKVHDFVAVKPFEGANNRTASIFLEKNGKTSYPIAYILWRPKEAVGQTDSLEEALKKTERIEMLATPSDEKNVLSPWLTLPEMALKAVQKARGKSYYKGYEGINSGGVNAVYWVRILDVKDKKETSIDVLPHLRRYFGEKVKALKLISIENITKGMKKKVEKVTTVIEDFFLYPLIKSRHVEKWKINGYIYTLQVQDPVKRIGYDETWVKVNFSKTYEYLKSFENIISKRSSGVVRQLMEKGAFYSMYAVGDYTYAPYKVVWNQMGNKLSACVVGTVNDRFLGEKLILPEHVLAFIPTDNEDEAHYLCTILNSPTVDLILRSIAGGTKSFGTPKIVEHTVKIPKFNNKNEIHVQLAALSKKAHKLASENNAGELSKTEEAIDNTVARLYGLTAEEVKEVKNSLKLLEGEEIEEEIVEEEPMEVTVDFLNAVASPNTAGSFEVAITNRLKDTVKIELQLPDRTVELETDKEQENIKVKVPPLPIGEHKIPYKIITRAKVAKGEFTLHVKEKKRFRKDESLTGKLDELLGEN
jgi:methylase of polypeptide subunit release factors